MQHTVYIFLLFGGKALALTIQYRRCGPVCEGDSTFEIYVEGKSSGRKILCTLGLPNLRPQHKTSSEQLCLYTNCTVMKDLTGAPAVHLNFPLQSFSLFIIFKSGIDATSKPIPLEPSLQCLLLLFFNSHKPK